MADSSCQFLNKLGLDNVDMHIFFSAYCAHVDENYMEGSSTWSHYDSTFISVKPDEQDGTKCMMKDVKWELNALEKPMSEPTLDTIGKMHQVLTYIKKKESIFLSPPSPQPSIMEAHKMLILS